MTLHLRAMRRRYGISQIHLADLVGVSQATVSRWESGAEEISASRRLELLDLFSNRNNKLDPVLKNLLRHNRNISVFDWNLTCLASSAAACRLTGIEPQAAIGKNYAHMLNTDWFSQIYGEIPPEERVYTEYVHALKGSASESRFVAPIWARQYSLKFEDQRGLLFSLVVPADPVIEPKLISRITTASIEHC